jgi:hypothetical protein
MPLRAVRWIVIHHPASDNVKLTLKDHFHPPFIAAPYDWWVEYPSGEIVKGRPLSMKGAHVVSDIPGKQNVNNLNSIGVAFEGNFDDDKPPIEPSPQQLEKGAALVGALCLEHNVHPRNVIPHREVTRTACPGKHFMAKWDVFLGKVKFYYNEGLKQAQEADGN